MQNSREKKVVLVIVEGPTDQTALEVSLENVYSKDNVMVMPVHGDLTTRPGVTASNAVSTVYEFVKDEIANRYIALEDLKCIVHVMDTDGAFVADGVIRTDENAVRPVYGLTEIATRDPYGIMLRNKQKSEVMRRLSMESKVKDVPYAAYYMSCNLEHVLHNKLNCSDEEKESLAMNFALKYEHDNAGFIDFITNSVFSVKGTHKQSWKFIRQGLESLNRHTNLGLAFEFGE